MTTTIKGYRTKIFNESLFVRVFYHSSKVDRGKDTWFNEKEIVFVNKNHKFSIIPSLYDKFKINGKFEFIIEYPESKITLHWNQTTNPIENVTDVGFIPISVDYPLFKGLARSNCYNSAIIDGTPGYSCNYWWFTIGSLKPLSNQKFPGYMKIVNGVEAQHPVYEVILWMRILDSSYINFLYPLIKKSCNQKRPIYLMKSLIFTFLVSS